MKYIKINRNPANPTRTWCLFKDKNTSKKEMECRLFKGDRVIVFVDTIAFSVGRVKTYSLDNSKFGYLNIEYVFSRNAAEVL